MRLILARHGNTFGPGETPRMVGVTEDLPLTAEGEGQARRLGLAMMEAKVTPVVAYASNLQRAWRFGQIAVGWRGVPVVMDARLNELDYGCWADKTTAEIEHMGDGAELAAWNTHSVWPDKAQFKPSEYEVRTRVRNFAYSLAERWQGKTVFMVSSNGIMRYFLDLVPGAFNAAIGDGNFKVKTGYVCELNWRDGQWSVAYWNQSPTVRIFKG